MHIYHTHSHRLVVPRETEVYVSYCWAEEALLLVFEMRRDTDCVVKPATCFLWQAGTALWHFGFDGQQYVLRDSHVVSACYGYNRNSTAAGNWLSDMDDKVWHTSIDIWYLKSTWDYVNWNLSPWIGECCIVFTRLYLTHLKPKFLVDHPT